MTVTVVIPCYNEEGYISHLLQDLTEQNQKPDAVIVVDCHSNDATVSEARQFSKRLRLQVLQSPYRSAAAARNAGAGVATTDYLLFIDADMRLPQDFIFQITKRAHDKHCDWVAAKLKSKDHNLIDHMIYWGVNLSTYGYHMAYKRRPAGTGGALLVSRKLHNLIGGYTPSLREFDDVDYFMRTWKHKVTYAYARKAVAMTSIVRDKDQGRLLRILQGISAHNFFGKYLIRPMMKVFGIKPKWHELD